MFTPVLIVSLYEEEDDNDTFISEGKEYLGKEKKQPAYKGYGIKMHLFF